MERNIKDKFKEAPGLVVKVLFSSYGYYDLKSKKIYTKEKGVKEFRAYDFKEKSIEIYDNVNTAFSQGN